MPILDLLIGPVTKILDKLIPDPAAKAQAQLELLRLQQAGEFKQVEVDLQLALAQTNINQAEAASSNLFVSGWRPAVGWVCVLGLVYQYLGQPLLTWASAAFDLPPPPAMDLGDLVILLGGMLGLGTLRTVEKRAGVAR